VIIPNLRGDIQRVARALHPLLLSNFLDSAPSVFTPSSGPDPTELGIVSAVADIYRNLYGPLLQSSKVRIRWIIEKPLFSPDFPAQLQHRLSLREPASYSGSEWHPTFPFFSALLLDATFKRVSLALPLLRSLIPLRIRSSRHFKILTSFFVNSRPSLILAYTTHGIRLHQPPRGMMDNSDPDTDFPSRGLRCAPIIWRLHFLAHSCTICDSSGLRGAASDCLDASQQQSRTS
jgi:hypothetical protein